MKKIMSLMLGLTLVLGTASMFAADEKADAKPATEEKKTKKKAPKKAEEKKAEATK